MNKGKAHRYVQPQGDKHCIIYNIANVFNTDIEYLEKYKINGLGTKDMELIIQSIGFPKAYIGNVGYTLRPHLIPKDSIKFIIQSVQPYCKDSDKFAVLPTTIKLKSGNLHSISILIGENKILISDPRKPNMIEVSLEELLSMLKAEQISIIMNCYGVKKHNLLRISI